MAANKVVVRYQDGRVLKGSTGDFLPAKPLFHVETVDAAPGTKATEVKVADLKAVFFVKDHAGDPGHREALEFEAGKAAVGRKIRVVFRDGETLVGTTQGYDPSRPGFFLLPADAGSNNERCFVVAKAAREVRFL